MLLLCQRLRQGINNVVICMYLSYFHISSDGMEVAKNMFGSLMRSGFLCLRNDSIVVTIEFYSIRTHFLRKRYAMSHGQESPLGFFHAKPL
ncbi:hypothetical protein V6N13_001811 [Hibiscus sabdariffa]